MFLLPAVVIFPGKLQTSPSSPADILKEGALRIGYSVRLPQPPRVREVDHVPSSVRVVKGRGPKVRGVRNTSRRVLLAISRKRGNEA